MIRAYTFTARSGALRIKRSIIAHCHAQAWRIGLRTIPENTCHWRISCRPMGML
jgi:hypothetical protein